MFGNIGIGNWALHQGVNIWAVTSVTSYCYFHCESAAIQSHVKQSKCMF